jgi:hypothetical protein
MQQYLVEHGLGGSSATTCVLYLPREATSGSVLQALLALLSLGNSHQCCGPVESSAELDLKQLGWRLMHGGRFLREVSRICYDAHAAYSTTILECTIIHRALKYALRIRYEIFPAVASVKFVHALLRVQMQQYKL